MSSPKKPPDISKELKICPSFKLTPELELDRKLLNARGMVEGTLLCKALGCTEREYWESVARLHYLGLIRFYFASDPDCPPMPAAR
jgi:hypothetical protein